MSGFNRLPLAVGCLGLGLAAGLLAHSRLTGQPPAEPVFPRDFVSFSPVVKRVLPAVVSIDGKGKGGAKVARPAQSDTQEPDPGFGSGVLIDKSGVVLTNNHVVAESDSVEVTLADGRKIISRDIRRDPKSDIAIVKLEVNAPLPFLELANSDTMEVGDQVLAIGAPFGLAGSVTHGIVSGKSRNNLRLNNFEDWIQTDAAVNPGSSGGPLVNLEGKVIGITAAIKTRNGGFSGVGLAVTSNLCKVVSSQLITAGVVRRGYLGANVKDLDDAVAAKLGVKPDAGVIVTRIYDNAPATKGGVVVGDLIASIGGRPSRTARDVQRIISDLPIGGAVEVNLIRDGKAVVVKVVIEEQPASYGTSTPAAPQPAVPGGGPTGIVPFQGLGLAVVDLTREQAARLGYPNDTKGALVLAVTRDSVADKAGVRAGLVIVKVDTTAIESAAGFKQALGTSDREKGAMVRLLRPSGEVEFAVLPVP